MTEREIERIFEETGVLQTGHFLLTSGRHSDKYMQCAKIQQYPWHMEALAKAAADGLPAADIVISPAVGAVIAGYEIARQLNIKNAFAERADGKMALRRGFAVQPGQRVIVVEDTVTTGGTVKEIIELVEQNGGTVAAVAALVDRSNGAVNFGVPFRAAYTADVKSYDADVCPLCKGGGVPLESHGSRRLGR
jgi:orotate phosphoribosyltransferase